MKMAQVIMDLMKLIKKELIDQILTVEIVHHQIMINFGDSDGPVRKHPGGFKEIHRVKNAN